MRSALIFVIRRILVADVGFVRVEIPILELGSGTPVVSVIAGVHGDETSSLLVVDELLRKVPNHLKGTLRVVLAANPLAQAEQRRQSFTDSLDLNRILPGQASGTITHRCGQSLLNIVTDSAAVIDLHCFDMETPLLGILIAGGTLEHQTRCNQLMKAFAPSQIWRLDKTREAEHKFTGCLGEVLNNAGIPNIAVEMNDQDRISSAQVNHCAEGLLRILAFMNVLENGTANSSTSTCQEPPIRTDAIQMCQEPLVVALRGSTPVAWTQWFLSTLGIPPNLVRTRTTDQTTGGIPMFERTPVTSPATGIFSPSLQPFDTIRIGDALGTLSLPGQSSVTVVAPITGTVMQIQWKKFVLPGTEIAAIGTKIRRTNHE